MPADVPTAPPGLVRPRTTGEVLDDAWRLYLADAPLLLALSGLFNVPAAVAVLLVLLTRFGPDALLPQLLLPAAAALFLPLTGLAAGACQEAFRRRAEGTPVGLGGCLAGALRRGVDHAAVHVPVVLVEVFVFWLAVLCWQRGGGVTVLTAGAFLFLCLPLVGTWVPTGAAHAIVAGREGRLFHALGAGAAEATRHAGKALAVACCRVPLLLLAALNLLVLTELALWVLGDLAGVDTAAAGVLLSANNPVWVATLLLLAWLLLSPFVEACNFLLHADARARYEGLDLWFRVRQQFPVPGKDRAVAGLLALGLGLFLAAPVLAGERVGQGRARQHLPTVRAVHQDLDRIRTEVEQAEPYPGSKRWVPALQDLARRLDPAGSSTKGPYRWFYQSLEGFGARDRPSAVQVLTELDRRLETAEQDLSSLAGPAEGPSAVPGRSKEEIKGLVPQRTEAAPEERAERRRPEPEPEREQRRPVERDDGGDGGGGAEVSGPAAPGVSLGGLGWFVLAGLVLAILVLAVVLFFQNRGSAPATPKPQTGETVPTLDDVLRQPQPQTAASLWRKAEQLAAAGNHLEAVRLLHAAVLATLHRAGLIRYEATRTNGEYVDQLRANGQSPGEVHEPFRRLTGLFEVKWYGERACRAADYEDCRGLAEQIRDLV